VSVEGLIEALVTNELMMAKVGAGLDLEILCGFSEEGYFVNVLIILFENLSDLCKIGVYLARPPGMGL
jgi:hypothetical protein